MIIRPIIRITMPRARNSKKTKNIRNTTYMKKNNNNKTNVIIQRKQKTQTRGDITKYKTRNGMRRRRRNNNTHAGVYTLCLLACLTVKGTHPIGKKLLASILHFYNESAQKIRPEGRWMLTEDFLYAWSQSEASISELTDSLLNVIALVRYETDYTSLSSSKQNNVLKMKN